MNLQPSSDKTKKKNINSNKTKEKVLFTLSVRTVSKSNKRSRISKHIQIKTYRYLGILF